MAQKVFQLLLTGNELTSGDIVDTNSAMIAQQLKPLGIEFKRKVTVSDDFELLVNEITALSHNSDVVIINGGLGPTRDDLTAQALASVAQVELAEHPHALAHLHSWCEKRHISLSKQNLKQALLPQGCDIVANSQGSAVGFTLTINRCLFICTPGVPSELKVMLNEELLPLLAKTQPNAVDYHVSRLQVFGMGESFVENLIETHFPHWPEDIELGYRAHASYLEIKLTSRSQQSAIKKQQWQQKLSEQLGDHLFHVIDEKPHSLAQCLVSLLEQKKLTLTTAESCSGGLISSEITRVAGASAVFQAGFITYSNHIKTAMLQVPEALFENEGAVSETCVRAMAQGALKNSQANLAIAVSGIAGPGGASVEKPVGTVCFAWGDPTQLNSLTLLIPGNRQQVQHRVSLIALDLVRRFIIESEQPPQYVLERKR